MRMPGRERREDLARTVMRDAAGPGQAEAGPAHQALERMGEHRRVRGHDDDAAPLAAVDARR